MNGVYPENKGNPCIASLSFFCVVGISVMFFLYFLRFSVCLIMCSSVQCVDAFRIALTEEPKLFIKQRHCQDCRPSVLLSSSDTKAFSFSYVEKTDKVLKSHYMIPNESSVNMEDTYKKQVCNRQSINWLFSRLQEVLDWTSKGRW